MGDVGSGYQPCPRCIQSLSQNWGWKWLPACCGTSLTVRLEPKLWSPQGGGELEQVRTQILF